MSAELASLLENKRCGEAQVAARKAIIASCDDAEVAGHTAALAREEADLASVTELCKKLSAPEKSKSK